MSATLEIADLRQRVETLVACSHRLQIRVRHDRAGRPRYVHQCIVCGERVGNPIARSLITAPCPAFDEAAEARRHEQRNAAWLQARDADRQQELSAWRAEHQRYLATPQWGRLRASVLQRAAGICEGCRTRRATQVHHLHYRRWQREMLFDLVAVCDTYHRSVHDVPEASEPCR